MDENFLRYNALDSACTLQIRNAIWDEISQNGYDKTYQMTLDIFPALMFMQTRGILVDQDKLGETRTDISNKIDTLQIELNTLCKRPINVNSSKDCQKYFYIEKGIDPYLKSGRPTIDDKALQRIARGTARRPGLREASLVQEIRGLQKLRGTYLDIDFDKDSRMRCSYNPRGTKFGRLSSSKTVFGTGMSFQTVPQEFKKFLVADPDYVMLEFDKRQAEWVVVAYASGDAGMISAIEKGIDVHAHTASLMYSVPVDLVKYENSLIGHTSDSEGIADIRSSDSVLVKELGSRFYQLPRTMSLRQCGKKSNHGLNYGEGYKNFALINEIEEREAKKIVELYHRIYPGIRLWYQHIQRQISKDRTLINCFGRKVKFLDAYNEDLFKSAYSMLPQSTVVDAVNMAMVKIYNNEELTGVNGFNIDLLAQVHDSILIQLPIKHLTNKGNFDKIVDLVNDYMSPVMEYNGRQFKIATDAKCGLNWGEARKDTNPYGMVDIRTHQDLMNHLQMAGVLNESGTRRLD